MISTQKFDVAILGGGLTGLFTARSFAQLGFSVVLIESQSAYIGAASTRNQGWLHRGTYHAASIDDTDYALRVARRCAFGYDFIYNYAPESVEDLDGLAFALTASAEMAEQATKRWDAVDIPYAPLSRDELQNMIPKLNMDGVYAGFRVRDVGINTRILGRKLQHDCVMAGVQMITGADTRLVDEKTLQISGQSSQICAEVFIHATGHSLQDFFLNNFDVDLEMRYWKSYVTAFPRFTTHNLFFVDSDAVNLTNHQQYSLIGVSRQDELTPVADYTMDSAVHDRVTTLVEKTFHFEEKLPATTHACIKVDMGKRMQEQVDGLSLDIAVNEPVPNHICVIPGKMTVIPFVASRLARWLFDRFEVKSITKRPFDEIEFDC